MFQLLSLSFFLMLSGQNIFAQGSGLRTDGEIFTFVERMPQFPGGEAEMYKFLAENIKYPALARQKKTEGKVIARFVVFEDGSVGRAEVIKGVGDGCDEEALSVIMMMPKWTPGYQNGVAVRVYFTLPVVYKLSK